MTARTEGVQIRWAAALGAALTVAGLSLPSIAQAQVTADLFVPTWTSQQVSLFDVQSGTIVSALALNGQPYNVAVTPDGRRAYITQMLGNTVTVLDVATQTVVATLPTGQTPRGVAITRDGTLVYVTTTGADLVAVFDVATNTQVKSIPTLSTPWGIALSPDGKRAVVANRMANAVSVIDLVTQQPTVVVSVDREPVEVAIAPDSKTAYVSSTLDNTVVPIDLEHNVVRPSIPVLKFPRGLAVTPDGKQVVVACSDDNMVVIIDLGTLSTTKLSTGANSLPSGVAISPDGRRAYIGTQGVMVNGKWTSSLFTLDISTQTFTGALLTDGQALRVGLGPNMIVPGIGGTALNVASDADLTTDGFTRYVVFNGGTLLAIGNWTTTRSVSLLTGGGTIDTNGFALEIDGGVINDGTLVKRGVGTLRLGGTSTHPATDVKQGALMLVGGAVHAGHVTLTGGSWLGGTGRVGDLDVPAGVISPGDSGPGLLQAQNITMNPGSTLLADIRPGAPGTGYDQVVALGTAALNGATLRLRVSGTILSGATFQIVTNTTGAFAGLPEGAVLGVTVGSQLIRFRITYLGGTSGHDAVLTVL